MDLTITTFGIRYMVNQIYISLEELSSHLYLHDTELYQLDMYIICTQ